MGQGQGAPGGAGQDKASATVSMTEIQAAAAGVTLMPNLSHNWIIATAPPDVLDLIEQWIGELDTPAEVEKDYGLY